MSEKRRNSLAPIHEASIIQRESPFPAPIGIAPSGSEEPSIQLSPLGILRRRWLLMLSVWLLVTAGGIVSVALFKKPEYRATGLIRVAPVINPVLFTDESGVLPAYSSFLNTQVRLIQNTRVLRRALDDPKLATLPWVTETVDPERALAERLVITVPRGSELIEVSISDISPDYLGDIVNAVLSAYMDLAVQGEDDQSRKNLSLLRTKQNELEFTLRGQRDQYYELAEERGATSLTRQQDVAFARIQPLQEQLVAAASARISAEAEVTAIQPRQAVQAPALTATEIERIKEQRFASDDELAALRSLQVNKRLELLSVSQKVGTEHGRVRQLRGEISKIEMQVAARRKTITDAVREEAGSLAQTQIDHDVTQAQQRLAQARLIEKALESMVKEDVTNAAALGRDEVALQFLREEIDHTKGLYDAVVQRVQLLEMESQRPARVTLFASANTPTTPSEDKRKKFALAAVFGALFCAAGVGFMRDRLDTSIRTEQDVAQHMGVPVLGTRARLESKPVTNKQTETIVSEELRTLRAALLFGDTPVDCHSLLVTSPNAREGKTTLVLDLGRALADSGRRVLLIDADNSKRDLSRRLGFAHEPGLADALGNGHIAADLLRATATGGMTLLTAGPRRSDFSELLAHPGRLDQFCELFKQYDNVVIDSPPVLLSSEPMVWARHVDVSLAVVRADQCPREDAKAARERLTQAGSHVIGAVLTGINPRDRYYRRRYAYTYEPKAEPSSSET